MNNSILSAKNRLYDFFMGKYYPIVVAAIVTVGHLSGVEFYLNIVNILLATLALCICDSIRPLFSVVVTFLYQINLEHSPGVPTYSDYYFTGPRLIVVLILGAFLVFGIGYFLWKNKIFLKLDFKKTRLLIPSLLLSLAFLMNGAFSKSHNNEGLIFGATQILVYLVLFLLFYLGTSERESADELVDYLVYLALVIFFALAIQLAYIFAFGDVISGGGINSDNINLGWTTKNPLGAIFVSLIPLLFYGAVKKKSGWIYLFSAVMAWICSVLTCSRNSLLFGTFIFLLCLIISCFKGGDRRKRFTYLGVIGACGALVMALVLRSQLASLFESVLKMGFDNNGRFKLWEQAWSLFCDNFLFGSGFFSIVDPEVYVSAEFMPTFAHNTVFELLASMGIFGLLTYGYYRFEILKMAFVRPNVKKTFLTIAVMTVALQSLLDVFVFCYCPVFLPMAALAALCRVCDEEIKSNN